MDDLAAFLNARLDEDEAAAKAWLPFGNPDAGQREHIARHDPARVLREVAAKRAVLAEHTSFIPDIGWNKGQPCCNTCGAGLDDVYLTVKWPCDTVKILAAVYSDHPDYRDGWKP